MVKRDMKEVITGKTKLFALLGCPVSHSLSPVMQNAALSYVGADARYMAFDVKPEFLLRAIEGLFRSGVSGINLTIPHKEKALSFMNELSITAAAVGAVNTIAVNDGRMIGHNTDVPGILRALKEDAGRAVSGERYVVLGAGGAARAVVYALLIGGADKVYLINRTVSRAEEVCLDFEAVAGGRLHSLSLRDINILTGCIDGLINATSVGLGDNSSPLNACGYDIIERGMLVYDLIYAPSPTVLLCKAAEKGAIVMDGLGMLVYQGAESMRIWLNKEAPAKIMKQSLLNYLGRGT
jgi:shikimate dehydrogenase